MCTACTSQCRLLMRQEVASPGVASGDGSAAALHVAPPVKNLQSNLLNTGAANAVVTDHRQADHLRRLSSRHKSRQAGTAASVCPCNNSRHHQDSHHLGWCLCAIRPRGRTVTGVAAAASALVAVLASLAATVSDHVLLATLAVTASDHVLLASLAATVSDHVLAKLAATVWDHAFWESISLIS
ncbi:hypothetical protein MLD38_028527 [Melastoma candidum]|uniref:Uncharacterized protein n=1 Tax=Melastoma candidum TaxID=119954 RepID=A0ACB9N326_9MYRT|nr:hypothetical protein MLD38_028527 [Melastoma candidum]